MSRGLARQVSLNRNGSSAVAGDCLGLRSGLLPSPCCCSGHHHDIDCNPEDCDCFESSQEQDICICLFTDCFEQMSLSQPRHSEKMQQMLSLMPLPLSTESFTSSASDLSSLDQFKACPYQCKSMGRNKKRTFDGYKYAPDSEWQCVNSCRSCVRGNMGAICRTSP
jgi:hypothetical protein